MRICSPHCGIDPETTSGGETYEREVLRHLAGLGLHIDILLARHKRYPEGIPNWTVHRLPIGRGLRWPVAPFVLPPVIKRVHDATGFDVLRVHSLRFIGPAALIARRRYRLDVPIVAHHHHLDADWLNPLIEGRVMRGVERVIVGSEFAVRQATAALGVPREKFAVVPYGVDRRFRREPRPAWLAARWGLDGAVVALFLGGLKRRKNLFFLLDAWREVTRARPDARLVIAGAGPLLEPLRRRAAELGQERAVVFAGYVPEGEKVAYYNLADLLLSPSAMEGFGLAVAEAMSCGLPVVVSNRGSLPELLVDGEGGYLVDPSDRDAFVRKALVLCGDPMLRGKFGTANVERVNRFFRWDHCAAATARVYEEVLREWRARRDAGPRGGGARRVSAAWRRPLIAAVDAVNRRGKGVGVRLVKYTGKSRHFIHPKHLVEAPWHDWYVAHLEPADVVLDVGCANGAHTVRAARRVRRVVGVDYDMGQLRVAAATTRALGLPNVRLLAWDLTRSFPFPDASFDAVLFLDVIEHLHPRVQVLTEIRRVLKPPGRLLVSGPNRDTSWRRRLRRAGLFAFSDPDHKIEYTREEFLAELAAGGFEPAGPVMPVVYDTPWAGMIDAVGGLSLELYARLSRWKRDAALRRPAESTGFRVVARIAP